MLIKQVKLHNIRSYVNQTIDFPEGSLLLSGDIGSGKSSILLAIEFALFGIMRGSLEGTSLLRNGKNTGSVELNLMIDDKNVIIKRTLKRLKDEIRQDSGYILIDGIKQDLTPVELKSRVLELLGYPDELITKSKSLIYRYTVYTPQEEMRAILFEAEEYRRDTLRKIFQIDKYQRVRENASLLVREIKSRAKALDVLVSDLEDKQRKKNGVAADLKKSRSGLSLIMPKISENKNFIMAQQEKLTESEQKIRELNLLKNQYSVAETKLSEKVRLIESNSTDIRVLSDDIERLRRGIEEISVKFDKDEIEMKIDEKERLYNEIVQEQRVVAQRKKDMLKDVSLKSVMLKEFPNKKDTLSSLIESVKDKDRLKAEIKKLEDEIATLRETVNESKITRENSEKIKSGISSISKCPTCLQAVSEEHKREICEKEDAKLRKALEQFEEATKTKNSRMDKLNETKNFFDDVLEKEKMLEKTKAEIKYLEEIEREIASKNKEFLELEEREIELKDKNPELIKAGLDKVKILLKQVTERMNTIKIIDEKNSQRDRFEKSQVALKRDVGDINKEKSRIASEIEKIKDVERIFLQEKHELEELKEKEKALLVEKTSLDKEIENSLRELTLLDEEINKRMKTKSEIQRMKSVQSWLEDYFTGLMELMERHVMARVYNEFNELFQRWFNILMEDQAMSVRLNEDFNPVIEQNGYEVPVASLSGGEKTSCALAYRLALNKVINDMITGIRTRDIIILDEPTDGFSTEQLEKVRDVIHQLNAKQVIIVSHEPKIESFVDNIIRVSKEEHTSGIVS